MNVDFDGLAPFICDFLCRGVVPYIRNEILRSKILSIKQVNAQVHRAISSAVWTGGIPNCAVAHFQSEALRRDFSKRFPTGQADLNATDEDAAVVVDEVAEDQDAVVSEDNASTVSYSIFQAMLLVLNILKERNGFVANKLSEGDRFEVVWATAAVLVVARTAHASDT